MAKFYATSGNRSIIVLAADAHEAATRMIDEVMGPHVWIYGDEDLCDADRRTHLALEAILNLDPHVRVSQRGHGRDEAGSFETATLVSHWHDLMTSMARMMS